MILPRALTLQEEIKLCKQGKHVLVTGFSWWKTKHKYESTVKICRSQNEKNQNKVGAFSI